MPIEIGELLDRTTWPTFAKMVTLFCAIAIIFDGFDISVVGYAIPRIMADWHLPRASFAPLLVIGFIGMSVGSLCAGFVGDRLGRRLALSLSVLLFGLATLATAFAPNLLVIEVLRFVAAAGIGGALPTAATMSGEFTPVKRRTIAVMMTIVCVPLGGAFAGSVANLVLPIWDWRALFSIGGLLPIALSVAMLLFLPESPRFLARHPARVTQLLRLLIRLGLTVPADATFCDASDSSTGQGIAFDDFLGAAQARSTLTLWLAFFCSASGVYLCFSWLPTLLTAIGFQNQASNGLAAYNYGGVLGVLCFVALVNQFGSRILTIGVSLLAALTASALVVGHFQAGPNAQLLISMLAVLGFCANALQTSLFALAVHVYPTRVRSSGVAVAASMGRLGAIASALVGPALIQLGRPPFFSFVAGALLLACLGITLLRNHIPRVAAKLLAV